MVTKPARSAFVSVALVWRQPLLGLAMAVVLTACANTTPDGAKMLAQAQMLTPEQVAEQYHIDEAWWRLYQDEQLNNLVQMALNNNIDLQKSLINLTKSSYSMQESHENLWPKMQGEGSVSDGVSKNLKTGGPSTRTASSSISLGVSYEVDLWQKVRASYRASVADYQASEQDLAAARLSLINRTIDGYFNLAYVNEAITIHEQLLAHQRRLADIAQSQYRHGKSAKIDAINAQQAVMGNEDSIRALQNTRENLLQDMRNILNMPPNQALAINPPSLKNYTPLQVDLDIPLSVLANRPDLRASESRLQQAYALEQVAKQSWYPSISLRTAVSATSNQQGAYFNIPVGLASVSVNLPFMDWQNLRWQNKRAKADFEIAKLDFTKNLTTALNEIDAYERQLRQSHTDLDQAQKRYAIDQQNTRYHRIRYQQGASALSDWLSAQNTELNSAQSVLNARYGVLQRENQLYQTMGGRLMPK